MHSDSAFVITVLLPILLIVMMFGIGLEMQVEDFRRVWKYPKAVAVGLSVKLLLLPTCAFALCHLFGLSPELSIGMILISASATSGVASVFSRLSEGDVALSLTLTAMDTVISSVSLPLLVTFAVAYFGGGSEKIGLQFADSVKIFLVMLVPVAVGMTVRANALNLANRLKRPLQKLSLVVIAILVVGPIVKERTMLAEHFGQLAGVTLTFNFFGVILGYLSGRIFRLARAQAISLTFAMGLLSTILALTISTSVLHSLTIALPVAFFGISMYFFAGAGVAFFKWQRRRG